MDRDVLTFKLEDQGFGVYIKDVKEIIKSPKRISKFIGDQNIRGVVNHRNSSLPIIDLIEKIQKKQESPIDNKYIIVIEGDNNNTCGFLVEDVDDIYHATTNDFTEVPTIINQMKEDNYVDNILKRDDNIYPILNLKKMI